MKVSSNEPSGARAECATPRRYDEPLQHTVVNTTYYAVTVKYNKGPPNSVMRFHYDIWLDNARRKGMQIHRFVYEFDHCKRLHVHAIVSGRKNMYINKFQLRGYHQDIQKIDTQEDKFNWEGYMDKCADNTFLELCKTEYMFIDD